ncbi:hypothetical protein LPLAFNJD_LOCUS2519 [Methylorubrum aminovorans]
MVHLTAKGSLRAQVEEAIAAHQPELSVRTVDSLTVLDGPFVISGPDGPFDSYQVRIAVPDGFPWNEPVVWETGERIPRIADRHVFPKDGNCCLGVWEEWLLTAPERTFAALLTGVMHDYFVSQSYFESTGEWPFGERSHGNAGVLESYSDLLGVPRDTSTVHRYLRLLSMTRVRGHHFCPCGSGDKLRQCHSVEIETLTKRIPPALAQRMLKRIT